MDSQRSITLDQLLNPRRPAIEFWRNNGDGTCTRLADGLTLSSTAYNALPGRNGSAPRIARWERQ